MHMKISSELKSPLFYDHAMRIFDTRVSLLDTVEHTLNMSKIFKLNKSGNT